MMKVLLIKKHSDWQVEFGVATLPNRRQKALVKVKEGEAKVLAWFRDEECVKEFMDIIDAILCASKNVKTNDAADDNKIA